MWERARNRVGSQKEILTKPRYTHKSLSVACPALVFYSYALCWRNKMTAEFLQRKIWCLSCFLHLPPSFPYSVYPSLYYSVTSQFCSLPLLSVFCFLFMVALCSLAMHFSFCCLSLSPFLMLILSFYLNVSIFCFWPFSIFALQVPYSFAFVSFISSYHWTFIWCEMNTIIQRFRVSKTF